MFVYDAAAGLRRRRGGVARCSSCCACCRRALVRGLRPGAPAQRRDAHGRLRGGDGGRRSCGPTGCRTARRPGCATPSTSQRDDGIRAGVLAALPVPVGRGVLGAHRGRRARRRCRPRTGVGAHGGRHGRVHLPRVQVPRADRRVHRDPRPDADRGGRLAARAGPAGDARSRSSTRTTASTCPAGRPRIEVDHVTFTYRPRPGQDDDVSEPALVDVSVHDRAGHNVAIVGATGSGKSTLAKLLTRLADPTVGRGAGGRRRPAPTCAWRRCGRRW